jgi:hypothetical protein
VQPYQQTQAKRYFWGIITPFDDNQDNWRRKEAKYKKEGTQQLQAQLYAKRTTMHHIRIAEGTTGMARESKTSITQIEETSPGTLTHLSYRSMSKATLCQKHQKQHLWRHKHICILHNQTQETRESTCIEQHYKD